MQDSMFVDGQPSKPTVEIDFDCFSFYTYSLAHVMPTPVRGLTIMNNSSTAIDELVIRIDSLTDLLTDREITLGTIPPGEMVEVDCSSVLVDVNRLLQLTEMVVDQLKIEFVEAGKVVFESVQEIRFFAFDQWLGTMSMESIAAFATPNHPALAQVIVNASKYLGEWTGSPSFTGYQSGDPALARMQAAALYRAVQEWGVIYNNPPASFAAPGQRVRLPDAVLEQHMATCLDFTVLYAALAEAVGLNPLIVFIEGHAFPGVWLEETSFQEVGETDYSSLSKRCAKGVEQITVFQSTDMAQGKDVPFEKAEEIGRSMLTPADFMIAVDVHRARTAGILPLPTRIMGSDGWRVEVDESSLSQALAPKSRGVSTAYIDVVDEPKTRKQVWERSLLDLSMNNTLLNMRTGKRAMPIFIPAIDEVEDTLALSNDLIIAPKIEGFPDLPDELAFSAIDVGESLKQALYREFKDGRLRTAFTQAALSRNLDNLYRSARSSLEETGANTLFLALGVLRWVDSKRGNQVRLAPIMLFPVDIVRKSAKTGYILRLRDDEPQINVSLIEMLRQDYEISIDGLDPLPQDDAGVDTRLVLNTFVNKIIDQEGWEVLETAAIGLFSFSQFVMFNDIRSHEEELRLSKVVNSMMEGHLTWEPHLLDPDEPVDPSELLLPVETDASQLFAVKAAVEGHSFVLHGPPGTGKSQTITTIIANALARGKKVLFVAEKMAALEVVERRLAALGLDPFCLEVHSTKATKNHVLDQIKRASEVGTAKDSGKYAAKLAEVQALRGKLDQYAGGLAHANAAGLSLRDQISRYMDAKGEVEALDIAPDFVRGIASPEDFAAKMNAAERLIALARPLAPLAAQPLFGIGGTGYSSRMPNELPGLLSSYRNAIESLQACADELASSGIANPAKRIEHAQVVARLRDAMTLGDIPVAWRQLVGNVGLQTQVYSVIKQHSDLEARCNALATRWHETFFTLDHQALSQEWIAAQSKGRLGRGKAVAQVVAQLQSCSKQTIGEQHVDAALRDLGALRQHEGSLAMALDGGRTLFSSFKNFDGTYDWNSIVRVYNQAVTAKTAFALQDSLALLSGVETADATALVQRYTAAWQVALEAESQLKRVLGELPVSEGESWASSAANLCERVEGNLDRLHDWMVWNESVQQAHALGLDSLLDYLRDHSVEDSTFESFAHGVYKAMCFESLDTTQGMSTFSAVRFDQMVQQYARADGELRELAKQQVFYEVARRSPNLTLLSAASRDAASLQKALRSRGRNVSIRSVLSESGDVVRDLCPCFLMSPLSVAQYLEPGKQSFDLLIFDEASQLQTCKAVGALSRAKEAVIVGDPRQMPPTSFFQGKMDTADFEEVSDLESVLEDCLALNMPQAYLKWHYRSQHESLIAFSNRRFYEGKMYTFPSADDRASRVEFQKVDGFFDRGGKRVNEAEARAIIDDVKRRFHDPALRDMSIGIVTFNIPQQTLIEDLFQKACVQDPDLEKWATSGDEPLFIKNLENVQGDERDVILFSITYAPDAAGKMSMNFGPINREGGWRRLNVAVTRARSSMRVFSSMEPMDIDPNRTSSAGPAALQAFISYAQRGSLGQAVASMPGDATSEDAIAIALCEKLEEAGYQTRRGVGRSSYKVDIAVVDPYDESRYLAGILLDGNTYGLAKTTRDREISQPRLLERLGWRCMRLWALEWWEDASATTSKVLAFLDAAKPQAKADAQSRSEEAAKQVVAPVPESSSSPSGQLPTTLDECVEVAGNEQKQSMQPPSENNRLVDDAPVQRGEPQQSDAVGVAEGANKSKDSEKPSARLVSAPALHIREESVASGSSAHSSPLIPLCEPYVFAVLPERRVDAADFDAIDNAELAKLVETILESEAPIEQSLLIKRLTLSFGITRVGAKIQRKCEAVIKRASCKKVPQAGRDIIWRRDQDPKNYCIYRTCDDDDRRRSVGELPLEELVAAAVDVLQDGGSLAQPDLVKAMTMKLGYKRVTSQMTDFVKKGISLGVRRSILERDGNIVRASMHPLHSADCVSDEASADSGCDPVLPASVDSSSIVAHGRDFAAGDLVFIDVETPNRNQDRICAIGAIRTDLAGTVKASLTTLVNPDADFDPVNVSIHGISERDVKGCPSLRELWDTQLGALFGDARVVGHNVRFDLSVLDKALASCGVGIGKVTYACTMSLASDVFPELEKYSLPNVCERCGVPMANHHDAGSDAQACMKAFLFMNARYNVASDRSSWLEYTPRATRLADTSLPFLKQSANTKSMNELISLAEDVVADGCVTLDEVIGLRWWIERNPMLGDDGVSGGLYTLLSAALEDGKVDDNEERELLAALRRLIDPISSSEQSPFDIRGKTYCLSGDFDYGSKSDVEKVLELSGGIRVSGPSKKCNYVIVGACGSAAFAHGNYGKKVERALELQEQGVDIKIVGEHDTGIL